MMISRMFYLASVCHLLAPFGAFADLGQYELIAVKPFGKLEVADPLIGRVFLEAQEVQGKRLTLYAIDAAGDQESCDKGKQISDQAYTAKIVEEGGNVVKPRFGGKVLAYTFNFKDALRDQKVYNPSSGKLAFCARVSTEVDYDRDGTKEVVSYLDTRFEAALDLKASFSSFDGTAVMIESDKPNKFDGEIESIVEITAFLCDDDNKKMDKSYTDGQDFRICVRTNEKLYFPVGFKSVVCKNKGETRTLFENNNPDSLTSLGNFQNGAIGFTSVVTTGYFSDSDSKFTCSGEVKVSTGRIKFPASVPVPAAPEKERDSGRTLSFSFESTIDADGTVPERRLQGEDDEAIEEAPFSIGIDLDTVETAAGASFGVGTLFSVSAWMAAAAVALLL